MKIVRDSNGELVYAYKGIELDKSNDYVCPTCGEPVQICQKKNGEYFFRHVTQVRHDGETEAHQKGKEELQESLVQQGYRSELERYEAMIGQIPDITIETGEKEWVLEYQCSVIPIKEMTSRTKALESLGRSVSWILGKKFLQKNLCEMSLYCIRYHPQLGNYLCFYTEKQWIIHHHLTLHLHKRKYLFQKSRCDLNKLDWKKMFQIFKESKKIQISQMVSKEQSWTKEEWQAFILSPQKENRPFLEALYHHRWTIEQLGVCRCYPKYSWSMKTYNLIWQGYLWMGIDRLKTNQIFTIEQCYAYLKKLADQKEIRFSSCYEQEKVCKCEIEVFLKKIMQETKMLTLLPDGKWKKIKTSKRSSSLLLV